MAPDNPVRRRFGRLHGLSMSLLLLQALAAAVVVMAAPKRPGEPAGALPDGDPRPANVPDPAPPSSGEGSPAPPDLD